MGRITWEPARIERLQTGSARYALEVATWLYSLAVWVRNRAFDRGLFLAHRVSVPVISVGNLVAGGTGKTAIVRFLAEHLRPRRVGILTRGYGHRLSSTPYRVKPEDSARRVGDEAAMLSRWLPDAIVVVCGDRRKGADSLRGKVDIILMDDGFQHRWLARDLDIVVVSPTHPGPLLPRGLTREPLSALTRAGLLWMHDDGLEASAVWRERVEALRAGGANGPGYDPRALLPWLPPGLELPWVCSRYRAAGLQPLGSVCWGPTGDEVTTALGGIAGAASGCSGRTGTEALTGKRVHVLTTIARGERVSAMMRHLGAIVTGESHLGDHGEVTAGMLRTIACKAACESAEMLVMTVKDAIKVEAIHDTSGVNLRVLDVEVEVSVPNGLKIIEEVADYTSWESPA